MDPVEFHSRLKSALAEADQEGGSKPRDVLLSFAASIDRMRRGEDPFTFPAPAGPTDTAEPSQPGPSPHSNAQGGPAAANANFNPEALFRLVPYAKRPQIEFLWSSPIPRNLRQHNLDRLFGRYLAHLAKDFPPTAAEFVANDAELVGRAAHAARAHEQSIYASAGGNKDAYDRASTGLQVQQQFLLGQGSTSGDGGHGGVPGL